MPDLDFTPATLSDIRAALRRRIAETSLRGIASELGMSPTGLGLFIDGKEALGKTVRRARAWFARHAQEEGQVEIAEVNALEVLLGPVAASRRDAARTDCRELLARLREPGVPV